jgi:hypothetical protein
MAKIIETRMKEDNQSGGIFPFPYLLIDKSEENNQ